LSQDFGSVDRDPDRSPAVAELRLVAHFRKLTNRLRWLARGVLVRTLRRRFRPGGRTFRRDSVPGVLGRTESSELRLIENSELFNRAWYVDRYRDVASSGIDPALHYLRYGAAEGRYPGPRFDTRWYIRENPDVAASGLNPLVHYLRHGAREGRPIRPGPAPSTAEPRTQPEGVSTPFVSGAADTDSSRSALRMVWLSGEPDTPGHIYRVARPVEAAAAAGAQVSSMRLADVSLHRDEIDCADAIVIWRGAWDANVAVATETAQRHGATLLFDLDDLMTEPDLARVEIIDGIRTQNLTEESVHGHYARVRDTMVAADFCLAATDELAQHMRRYGKPTLVLPNGFDFELLRGARGAARRRRQATEDGLIRIGYATGTRTHQRDLAQAADAIAHVLRERPHCRLVLFADRGPMIDIAEFPALQGLEDRIEWRQLVAPPSLPEELARFDINIIPLELGNPFCEAKSELKFFEAALVDVCTIASPTGPLRRAIEHGCTGWLASGSAEWQAGLLQLVDDPALRRRLGRAAYLDVLWRFGPERRAELMASVVEQLRGGRVAARAFELEVHRAAAPRVMPRLPETATIFEADALVESELTVIVPLYNYARFVTEALDSVWAQTLEPLELVVIDDCSTDASLEVAVAWARRHAARFNRLLVLRNLANSGLGVTRNAGFAAAETRFVLPLDADNRLLPECCARLLDEARRSGAAFTYPVIREFGDSSDLVGVYPYSPARLIGGNYVDAMAIVSTAAWAAVGGYGDTRYGWEDYDFWCRMAERGLFGQQLAGTPLAEYRVHGSSMLRSITDTPSIKQRVIREMHRRHSWLSIATAAAPAAAAPRGSESPEPPPVER
jgi:glycosyltransferase involved in cell wall biosynthesis